MRRQLQTVQRPQRFLSRHLAIGKARTGAPTSRPFSERLGADAEPDLQNALGLLTDYLDRCACDLSELHSRQARKTRVFAT